MSSLVRAMLEQLYGAFHEKFQDNQMAWDRMVAFIASLHYGPLILQLNDELDWTVEDSALVDKVSHIYDPKLHESDDLDTLGDTYLEKLITDTATREKSQYSTPTWLADFIAQSFIPKSDKRVSVLDPAVGTGRLIIAAHKLAPKGIFFGIDADLRALRVAYTNFKIHGIHGYLLHADTQFHATDLESEEGKHNWEFSNKWYSCMNKLLPIYSLQN